MKTKPTNTRKSNKAALVAPLVAASVVAEVPAKVDHFANSATDRARLEAIGTALKKAPYHIADLRVVKPVWNPPTKGNKYTVSGLSLPSGVAFEGEYHVKDAPNAYAAKALYLEAFKAQVDALSTPAEAPAQDEAPAPQDNESEAPAEEAASDEAPANDEASGDEGSGEE